MGELGGWESERERKEGMPDAASLSMDTPGSNTIPWGLPVVLPCVIFVLGRVKFRNSGATELRTWSLKSA